MDKEFVLDVGERTFWTAAEAGLAYLTTVIAGIPKWWALCIAPALAAAKGFVAHKVASDAGASPAALPLRRR